MADGAAERSVARARLRGSPALIVGRWLYAILTVIALAHLATAGAGGDRPPLLWLTIGYGWWIAISFVLLQAAVGRRVLGRWLRPGVGRDPLTFWLASFTGGFWLSVLASIVLAASGHLDRLGVVLYLVASALVVMLQEPPSLRSVARSFLPDRDRSLFVTLSLAIGVLFVASPYLIQSLLPNADWDAASTHLPLAEWLGRHGLSAIPPDLSNLIIPGAVHLVYAGFMALGAEQAIIPLNLVVSVLTCLAAGALSSRCWGRAAGWWGFWVCVSINLLMELGLDPRIDGFVAFFATVGALGILVWVLEDRAAGALPLAGMALGLALGVKYTAIFPVVLWAIPVLWVVVREGVRTGTWRGRGVAAAALCLFVPSGYWYVANAFRYGDPIYPLLRQPSVTTSDGREVVLAEAVDELIASARDDSLFRERLEWTWSGGAVEDPPHTLFNPISVYLHPDLHARKVAHTLSPLLLLGLLLPLFRRDRASWLVSWMGLSCFLAIGAQTYLLRYGLVCYPLLAVAASGVLSGPRSRSWRVVWGAALALVLLGNLHAEWSKLRRLQPWSWLGGERDRIGWLSAVGYNGNTSMPRFIGVIDELRARGISLDRGKTLMVGEAKTHLFPFESIPDISRIGRPWLTRLVRNEGDLESLHRNLWDEGVRHILVNVGYFEWVKNRVRVDQERIVFSLHELELFGRGHGEVVFDGFGILLIRIDPPT